MNTGNFILKDLAKFKRECLRRLGRLLEMPGLRFSTSSVGDTERYLLRNFGALETVPLARDMPLIELFSCSDQQFWLAVEVKIEHRRRLALLSHVSAQVYTGLASDPDKQQWLRAEWDARKTSGRHAQPHWQLVFGGLGRSEWGSREVEIFSAASLDEPAAGDELLLEYEEGSRAGLAGRRPEISSPHWIASLERFHFAMIARWATHDGKDHWSLPGNDVEVARWLEQCVGYIRDQLVYCYEHAA